MTFYVVNLNVMAAYDLVYSGQLGKIKYLGT
jgi:hypothetical protein